MGKTLLLADDSVTIQKVVGITFASEDFDLVTVDNGDEALRRAIEIRPDLILADVGMPGLDGYELCGEIRKHPDLAHVPVLLLTGTFEIFDEQRAQAVGASAYISKPFEAKALVDQVHALLESSAANIRPPTAPAQPAAAEPAASGIESPEIHELPSSDFFEFEEPITQTRVVPDSPGIDADVLPWPQAPDLLDSDEEHAPPARRPFAMEEFSFDGLDFDAPSTAGSGETAIFGDANRWADPEPASPDATRAIDPASALTAYLDAEIESLDDGASIWGSPVSDGDRTAYIEDPSGILGEPSQELEPLADAPPPTGVEDRHTIEADATPPLAPTSTEDPWAAMEAMLVASHDAAVTSLPATEPQFDIAPAETPAAMGTALAVDVEEIDLTAEEAEPDAIAPMEDWPREEPTPPVAVPSQDLLSIEDDTKPAAVIDSGSGKPGFATDEVREQAPSPVATQTPAPSSPVHIDPAALHAALEKVAWEAFGALSEQLVRQVVSKVEEIAWEVVPQLAERLIQEEIARLKADSDPD
jgi:CheY-like chemotaxis protein